MRTTTNLLFLVLLIFLSCNKDDDNENDHEQSESSTIDSSDYLIFFSGKLDDKPFIYGVKGDGTTDYGSYKSGSLGAVCAYFPDTGGFNYVSGVSSLSKNLPTMDVNFIRFHLCSNDDSQYQVFNTLFPKRNYNFADSGNENFGPQGLIGLSYNASNEGPYL